MTPPLDTLTHPQLVSRASRWLRNTRQCVVVVVDRPRSVGGETPDAIGWKGNGRSILVECKLTVADWYADRRKPWRQPDCGMGTERWYLTPRGLLSGYPMPDGWGLLEIHGSQIRIVIPTGINTPNYPAEIDRLVRAVREAQCFYRNPRK